MGVLGASEPMSTASSSAASVVSAFRSILLFAVSGRPSSQWNADGTMYSGSDAASRSRKTSTSTGRSQL
jgi:hypothetical protein